MEKKINTQIPLFALTRDKNFYYAAGGGGSSNTGVKNGIIKIAQLTEEHTFHSTETNSISSIITVKNPNKEGRLIIYASYEYLYVCNEELEVLHKVRGLDVEDAEDNMIEVTQLVYSKKTHCLYVGWSTGIIQKYSLTQENDLKLIFTFEELEEAKDGNINGMCISVNENRLFATSNKRMLNVYNCEDGKIIKTVYPEDLNKKWDSSSFWGCAISYDGNETILGLMKKNNPSYLAIMDSHEFKLKNSIYLCKGQISTSISTDKMKTMASIGCSDGFVVVISLVKYKVLCVKKHHSFVVTKTAIDFKQNVASVSVDYNCVVSPISKKPYRLICFILFVVILLAVLYFLASH